MTGLEVLAIGVGGVTTWRLSHMLLFENGPFKIFRRLREKLGVVYYPNSDDVASYKYEITICIWCLSMWVGTGVTIVLLLVPWAVWLMLPFVFSASAVILNRVASSVKAKG